ncbi:hypothetical protein SAMN02910369_02319, partial [Lachnospiraceae bacterium NE2001]
MKKKYIIVRNRIISVGLATALAFGAPYSVPLKGGVNAEDIILEVDTVASGTVLWAGNTIEYPEDGSITLNDADIIYLTVSSPNMMDIDTSAYGSIGSLSDKDNYILITNESTAGVTISSVNISKADSSFTNYGKVSSTSFNVAGTVYNNSEGTITATNFTSPQGGQNAGTITASNVIWNKGFTSSGTVSVSNSLTLSGYSVGDVVPCTFSVSSDTILSNPGGAVFTISVDGETTTIDQGSFEEMSVYDLLNPPVPVEITASSDINVYYGTNYDVTLADFIHFSDGYSGDWSIKYYSDSDGSDEISKDAMTYRHTYYFKVFAEEDDTYLEGESDIFEFYTALMPLPEDPFTISGVRNTYYAKDKVVIIPPEGFRIRRNEGDEVFEDTTVFTKAEMDYYKESYGGFNEDLDFCLKDTDTGAQTVYQTYHNLFPELSDIVFDSQDPAVSKFTVDVEDETFVNESTVTAETVDIYISDENLEKVSAFGETYTRANSGVYADGTTYTCKLTIDSEQDSPKTCEITAIDMSGNEKTFSFTLKNPNDRIEHTISLANLGDVYVGTSYDFTSKIQKSDENYDGEITLQYRSESEIITKPDATADNIGTYTVMAIASETTRYVGTESSPKSFSIKYLDTPEHELTVSGLSNTYYTKDTFTVNAPTGYKIKLDKDGASFGDSITLSKSDIYIDEMIDEALGYYLKKNTNNAETDRIGLLSQLPIMEDIIFDSDAPVISGTPTVDGASKDIADGDDVTGEEVNITIADANLDKVIYVVGSESHTLTGDNITAGTGENPDTAVVTIDAVEGIPSDVSITAYDKSGNDYSFGFTLTHPRDLKNNTVISVDDLDPIYVGTTYDFSDKISIPDYDGEYEIKYYDGDTEISKPSTAAPGSYFFKVVAPETDNFKSAESEMIPFSISYLPLPEDAITLSGLTNGNYAKTEVTVTPATNYTIKSSLADSSFSTSLTLSRSDLYVSDGDGGEMFNDDLCFYLKYRDGAETDMATLSDELPAIRNVIFDSNAPVISGTPTVDGEETSITDGADVTGEEVNITIADTNLDKVVYEVGDVSHTLTGDDITAGTGDNPDTTVVTIDAEEGNPAAVSITAYDKSGNEFTFGFTLTHPRDLLVEPTVTIADLGTVYYGTTYDFTDKITVPTDYNGEMTIEYFKEGRKVEKPSVPGTYSIKVSLSETAKYRETTTEDKAFVIDYLPLPESSVSLSGVVNTNYAKNEITVIPASGFTIKSSEGTTFGTSLTLTKSDLFVDDGDGNEVYNSSFGFYLKRSDDDAETDKAILSTELPVVPNIIFDAAAPVISGTPTVDGASKDIADGDDVTGEEVNITIADANLDRVEVVTDGVTSTLSGDDITAGTGDNPDTAVVTIDAVEGIPSDVSITAYDKSGNEFTFGFTLTHPRDLKNNTVISVDDLDPVYVGTTYDFSDKISIPDYDGEYEIKYYDGDTEISKPST